MIFILVATTFAAQNYWTQVECPAMVPSQPLGRGQDASCRRVADLALA